MREILFRGKRIDNGEWVEGLPFGSIYGGFSNGAICAIRQTVEKYGDIHEVTPETVGQFTGLYDNKGTRIFEGDIIALRSSGSIYEAAYDTTDAKFIILLRNGKDSFRRFYNSDYFFSVIGNKWDNLELLEVEE